MPYQNKPCSARGRGIFLKTRKGLFEMLEWQPAASLCGAENLYPEQAARLPTTGQAYMHFIQPR